MRHAVPLLVLGGVLEAEVRADVDRTHALLDERHERLCAGRLRQRREDDVDALGHLRLDLHVDVRQVWERLAELLAHGASPRDLRKLYVRVAVQYAGQLYA